MKMTRMFPIILILVLALQLGAVAPQPDKKLAKEIDAVMSAVYKPGEPGAAVIVRRGGQIIFRKGYG
jgi:CubicO group peptidase (beta-lactamase class C family)